MTMKAFAFHRPRDLAGAIETVTSAPGAVLEAGGVDLLDRMKERVEEPGHVVALLDLGPLREIGLVEDGFHVGALATLADLAAEDDVRAFAPTLAEAAREAASPQIRNRATLGGNLAQHTRCGYYRHRSFPCWKRGDPACPVLAPGAVQETAAVFGNGACASAHPSSLAPVLGSLGAAIQVRGPKGPRTILFDDFWRAPAAGRASDTVLEPGDVIAGVLIPFHPAGARFGYVEIRQKAAFDWPLAAAAVRYDLVDGKIAAASVWLGAVAPAPWRVPAAEQALVGSPFTEALAEKAAEAAVKGATPLPGNAYKLHLVRAAVRRALVGAKGVGR
jgi:xanthine dehydrogenase YagS FAD-binding subunit